MFLEIIVVALVLNGTAIFVRYAIIKRWLHLIAERQRRCPLLPDKRIIKGRRFGAGFDPSHQRLQQGAPS